MNKNLATWLEEAETSVHYEGSRAVWEQRFIELHKEYERANKIIDRLLVTV